MNPNDNQVKNETSSDSQDRPEETSHAESKITAVRHRLINNSLVITVVALVLSMFQVWQSRQSERDIKSIAEQSRQSERDIKSIAESIYTQYLDKFPKNIPSINKLLDGTTGSLLLVTDFPAYGNFYHHAAFSDYRLKLEALTLPARKIRIRLLTYDKATRRKKLEKHFANRKIEELRKEGLFANLDEQHKPKTHDDAYRIVEEGNSQFLSELQSRNVEITETSNDLPVFVWIRDVDREAILSFYFYGESPEEVSFHTIDPKLIKVLQDIAEEAFKTGSKYTAQSAAVDLHPPLTEGVSNR